MPERVIQRNLSPMGDMYARLADCFWAITLALPVLLLIWFICGCRHSDRATRITGPDYLTGPAAWHNTQIEQCMHDNMIDLVRPRRIQIQAVPAQGWAGPYPYFRSDGSDYCAVTYGDRIDIAVAEGNLYSDPILAHEIMHVWQFSNKLDMSVQHPFELAPCGTLWVDR